jgi:hypothetical protein
MKALKIKNKSALLQADRYHSLLPPSRRQLLATSPHSGHVLASVLPPGTNGHVLPRDRSGAPGSFRHPAFRRPSIDSFEFDCPPEDCDEASADVHWV